MLVVGELTESLSVANVTPPVRTAQLARPWWAKVSSHGFDGDGDGDGDCRGAAPLDLVAGPYGTALEPGFQKIGGLRASRNRDKTN